MNLVDRRFRPPSRRPSMLLAAAAVLALCGLAVHRRSRQAERDFPPLGRFVTVRGVRLHYRDFGGEGPPLVLLHGNGTLAEEFDISGLVALARPRYRVIAFDRPGYGYSERPRGTVWTAQAQAELLHAALGALGILDPVVLGHSAGTQVAIAMGLRHPQSLRALVLASGYYFPTPRLELPFFSAPALPLLGTLMRHTVSPLLGRLMWPLMVRHLFAPSPVPEAFRRRFPVWMALRPSQLQATAAERALMVAGAAALSSGYRGLAVPAVLLSGDGDREVSPGWQTLRLHRRLPDSRLVQVHGAGHMVHHVAPAAVLAAVDAAMEMAGSSVPAVHRASAPRGAGAARAALA
ncbi:alpha/beta fold hydrolase [Caldimonas tepidiphila]|uniref:alpha/beta fold hydrolase n=1 Tax=Caldimonas tepidiphila TaxID=2315841 RepID=UPI000E5AAB72|nr:alpha/beta hydrolase [Caldimonas tepidiphila]